MNPSVVDPARLKIDLIPADSSGDAMLTRLLDATFPVPADCHFFDDFPIWSAAAAGHLMSSGRMVRLGVFDGADLVGAAGVRLGELKLEEPGGSRKRLKAALIGGVATLPNYQGHGFASRLVSIAASWAQERGAALAALWGSEHALYARLGFELCGQQLRVKLTSLSTEEVQKNANDGALEIHRGWTPAILDLLQERAGGLTLTEADRFWLEAHRNVDWYWTGDVDLPTAYAAVNRGIDLRGMVHEWGGEKAALTSLLARIRADHPYAELLGPAWQFAHYGFSTDLATAEFLCLAKVLDLPAVLAAFDRGRAPTSAGAPAMQALFGPPSAEAPFPLRLWFWGLDAV